MFAASIEFSFKAKQDGPVYVYHGAALNKSNGSTESVVRYLGYYHKGDIVTGYLPVTSDYVNKVTFEEYAGRFRAAYADLEALQNMSEVVASRPSTLEKIKDSHLKGNVSIEKGQELLFTVPWDEGWSCYVDGKEVELTKVLGIFMAAEIEPGEHIYEMFYTPDGMNVGLKISLGAMIVLILYLVFGRKWIDRALLQKSIDDSLRTDEDNTNYYSNNCIDSINVSDKDDQNDNRPTISTNESTHRPSKRLHGLDFVKIIATLLIVLHHYQQVHGVYFEDGINFYYGKFYFGWIVELFFVISGYVMYPYIKRIKSGLHIKDFIWSRYFRFQPLMAISVIICLILMFLFKALYKMPWQNVEMNFGDFILSASGLYALWNIVLINNPLWYIGVLLICYIIMYGVVIVSKKASYISWIGFTLMIILGICIYNIGVDTFLLNNRMARGLYSFFWGLLIAGIINWRRPNKIIYVVAGAFILIFPFIVIVANEYVNTSLNYLSTFFCYTAVVLVFSSEAVNRVFKSDIWELLSGISYHAYIWHSAVFILAALLYFMIGIIPDFNNLLTLVFMALGVYIIATLSFFITNLLRRRVKEDVRVQ